MFMSFVIAGGELEPTAEEIRDSFSEDDSFDEIVMVEDRSLESLAVLAGIFPSKGRARKNGFSGPIPHGISFLGTKKKKFWVWCAEPPETEPTLAKSFDHTKKWFSNNITALLFNVRGAVE